MSEQKLWWIAIAVTAYAISYFTSEYLLKKRSKLLNLLALAAIAAIISILPNNYHWMFIISTTSGAITTVRQYILKSNLLIIIPILILLYLSQSCKKCNINNFPIKTNNCSIEEPNCKKENFKAHWKNGAITIDKKIYSQHATPYKIQQSENQLIIIIQDTTKQICSKLCLNHYKCNGFQEKVEINKLPSTTEIRISYPEEFWKCWNKSPQHQKTFVQLYYQNQTHPSNQIQ